MQLLTKFKKILYMEFRATLNFRKVKVSLNPTYRIFLNFAKNCALLCLLNVENIKKFHHAVFEFLTPKAVIKGVFSRSYCCYGYLSCYEIDNNIFTIGWTVFLIP